MIKINLEKARELTKERLRKWRDAQFKANDIALQNALADNDETARHNAITRRDWLRDLPDMANDKSLDDLARLNADYTL